MNNLKADKKIMMDDLNPQKKIMLEDLIPNFNKWRAQRALCSTLPISDDDIKTIVENYREFAATVDGVVPFTYRLVYNGSEGLCFKYNCYGDGDDAMLSNYKDALWIGVPSVLGLSKLEIHPASDSLTVGEDYLVEFVRNMDGSLILKRNTKLRKL